MGGNYEKSIYNQLMEVMGRLDAVEKDLHVEKAQHKEDVDRLNVSISELTCENQLLRDDNERLKSIINTGTGSRINFKLHMTYLQKTVTAKLILHTFRLLFQRLCDTIFSLKQTVSVTLIDKGLFKAEHRENFMI